MAEELKPCPFCGSEVSIEHDDGLSFFRCAAASTCRGSGLIAFCATNQVGTAISAWNTRAQQPSQGGEAVEVVAYRYTSSARLGGKWHYQESFPKWDDRKVSEIGQMDALMTVAQHNRIVAAGTSAGSRVVSVELLEQWANDLALHGVGNIDAAQQIDTLLKGGRA